jgi:hypothetical protein
MGTLIRIQQIRRRPAPSILSGFAEAEGIAPDLSAVDEAFFVRSI